MPRNYSEKFLTELFSPGAKSDGEIFAKACIKAKLPANYVAKAIGVSRITVHAWFRGQPIRRKNGKTVDAFMNLLEKDTKAGILPVKGVRQAKEYIENMVGMKI
jgi:hypothetical protein